MKKALLITFFVVIAYMPLSMASISNLHWTQQQLLDYNDSGSYQTAIKLVTQKARQYLGYRIEHNAEKQKLAIMLDVDETTLSNFKAIRTLWRIGANVGDTINPKDLNTITHPFNDPAIKPTQQLYRYALQHRVAVFFITGRTANDLKGTIANLKKVGYNRWTQLILRQPNQYHLSAIKYKQAAAASIRQKGYDLVLAMGDQYSDLPKKQADACFKLPNPFYYIG